MDPFELLISDHRKVSELFEQIENDDDLSIQENTFARIKQELTVHAEIEETYLYPLVRQYEETEEMTDEALEEHQEVKQLLMELDEISPTHEDWEDMIQELKDAVEHHVEEEENELFPKTKEVLNQETIDQLGTDLQRGKQLFMKAAM
jgi:hemerythrin superfamily protein